MSPSSRGHGLKYRLSWWKHIRQCRPLHECVDWNDSIIDTLTNNIKSPSSRGRGLKLRHIAKRMNWTSVALFTRAWIEIPYNWTASDPARVALFTRAWIEILAQASCLLCLLSPSSRGRGLKYDATAVSISKISRPLHEGVDWNKGIFLASQCKSQVALFTRAWIEIAWRCRYVQSSSSVTLSASASFLAVDILQSPLRSMFSIVLTGTPDSWDNAGTVSSLFSLSCLKFISILLSVFYNPVYDFCCSERDEQDA